MNSGVKKKSVTRRSILWLLAVGGVLFFGNGPLLGLRLFAALRTLLYGLTLLAGYLCLMAGSLRISRLMKSRLLEDPFNEENESFMQEMRLKTNEHSVNLPTRFR